MNRLEGYCYWQQLARPDCSFNWSRLCQPPLTQLAFPWQAVQWFADGGSLTLLFLGAVGLSRTWDLRGYTADGLALLDLPNASLRLSVYRSLLSLRKLL